MVRSMHAGPVSDAGRWAPRGVAGDAGQVVPLAAALMVLVVVALVALVPAAEALADRARASSAADAAALAGAAEGEDAARRLAVANGAELVSFRREADEVVVRVRVGAVEAEARARGRRAVPGVDFAGSLPSRPPGASRPVRCVVSRLQSAGIGARLRTHAVDSGRCRLKRPESPPAARITGSLRPMGRRRLTAAGTATPSTHLTRLRGLVPRPRALPRWRLPPPRPPRPPRRAAARPPPTPFRPRR